MTQSQALIVKFPEDLAAMSEQEVRAAIAEIDAEVTVIMEKRKTLLQERKLLDLLGWVMHPESFAPEYRNVAMTVQSRLRRARELKAGSGITKNEEYRQIAENVTSETHKIDTRKVSLCCEAGTFQGEKHDDGDRYCAECGDPCIWNLATRS